MKLVVGDAHTGLRKAIERCMGCSWQQRRVHFMRNVLGVVPTGRKDMVASFIRTAFAECTLQDTRAKWQEVSAQLGKLYPRVCELMDEAMEDVLAHRSCPETLWPQLASTNGLERLNREIKRRADVVQIFPNEGGVIRLVGSILMEQHAEWQVTRRQTTRGSLGRETL